MYDPGKRTPGRESPGLETPSFDTPGHPTPGEAYPTTQSSTGVAIDSTGTTTLGTVEGDRDITLEVRVDATATDFNFNVSVGGDNLFSSAQTVSSTNEETFDPDTNADVLESAVDEDVVFEVTSASGTGGATADVDVDAVSDNQT